MPEEVQVLEPSSARPRPSHWRRLAVVALFLLPVAYFAEILAVAAGLDFHSLKVTEPAPTRRRGYVVETD